MIATIAICHVSFVKECTNSWAYLKFQQVPIRTMADCAKREYLFVYGTLRRGLANPISDFLSRHADLVGNGSFRGRLYDAGRYPCVVPSDDERDRVVGDIFALKEGCKAWHVLDGYECCDIENPDRGVYIRAGVEVDIEDGERVHAGSASITRALKALGPYHREIISWH